MAIKEFPTNASSCFVKLEYDSDFEELRAVFRNEQDREYTYHDVPDSLIEAMEDEAYGRGSLGKAFRKYIQGLPFTVRYI